MKKTIKKITNVFMAILALASIAMFIGFAFVPCVHAFIVPGLTSMIAIAWFTYTLVAKIKKNKAISKTNELLVNTL